MVKLSETFCKNEVNILDLKFTIQALKGRKNQY